MKLIWKTPKWNRMKEMWPQSQRKDQEKALDKPTWERQFVRRDQIFPVLVVLKLLVIFTDTRKK